LWFSIDGPGRAVPCKLRAGWAAKVLARAISNEDTFYEKLFSSNFFLVDDRYIALQSHVMFTVLDYISL